MNAIAIDMGGSKIEGALVNDRAEILRESRVMTEVSLGKEKVLENLESVISKVMSEQDNARGIGISMPGFVDADGKVLWSGKVSCLMNFELKEYLEEKFKLPVVIENDADCFTLAEAVHGAGRGSRVVVGVIWGSGIGCGIVEDGRIFSGAIGAAGEFGHVVVDSRITTGRRCECGQYGCLENLASGSAITESYHRSGGRMIDTDPREIYDSEEGIAQEVVRDAIHYMGLGVSGLVNILNPNIIVFGGGVSKLPDAVYREIEREMKKYALKELTKDLKIVRHQISDSAGVIGAATLVFDRVR